MTATIHHLPVKGKSVRTEDGKRFPAKWDGELNGRFFIAVPDVSKVKLSRQCVTCERIVRRSWRTGILHRHCFTCRYLIMIYGPNIRVEYKEEK